MEMKLPAYQQTLFKSEDDDSVKSAAIERQCLVHLVKASCARLDIPIKTHVVTNSFYS